jgi:hypothetical protein
MGKKVSIDPALTRFVSALMEKATSDEAMSLDDKLSILDRGLKLEALKQRLKDEQYGGDFDDEESTDE